MCEYSFLGKERGGKRKRMFPLSRTLKAMRIYNGEERVTCFLIGGGEVLPLRGEFERLYMRTCFRFCPISSNHYSLCLHYHFLHLALAHGTGKIQMG